MLQWNIDHERAAERRAEALAESEEALRLQPGARRGPRLARRTCSRYLGRGEEAEQRLPPCARAQSVARRTRATSTRDTSSRPGASARRPTMFEEAARRDPEDFASLGLLVDGLRPGSATRFGPARRPGAASRSPNGACATTRTTSGRCTSSAGAYVDLGDRERDAGAARAGAGALLRTTSRRSTTSRASTPGSASGSARSTRSTARWLPVAAPASGSRTTRTSTRSAPSRGSRRSCDA